jgi:hypothetical protein
MVGRYRRHNESRCGRGQGLSRAVHCASVEQIIIQSSFQHVIFIQSKCKRVRSNETFRLHRIGIWTGRPHLFTVSWTCLIARGGSICGLSPGQSQTSSTTHHVDLSRGQQWQTHYCVWIRIGKEGHCVWMFLVRVHPSRNILQRKL